MIDIDLKGGLSHFIIKKALKMQGKQLETIKPVIPKYLKENPDCPYI